MASGDSPIEAEMQRLADLRRKVDAAEILISLKAAESPK